MRETVLMKNVWVSGESPFKFSEKVEPSTGKKTFVMQGLMLPFNKISRNNVLYNADSIKERHKELIGRPLMYNHKVDSTELPVGHFVNSWLEEDGWHYKADIDPQEQDIIRKLGRGDLRHVSIQLIGGKVVEKLNEENQTYTEAWISDIIEGSIVPAPGFLDTTASFAEALKAEDVSTTTGKGAIAPTQPLDKTKERFKEQVDEFPIDQFKQGLEVELEHSDTTGDNIFTMAKIVIDHLSEDTEYYTKLKDVEAKSEEAVKVGDMVHSPSGFAKVISVKGNKVVVHSTDPVGDFEYDLSQVHSESFAEQIKDAQEIIKREGTNNAVILLKEFKHQIGDPVVIPFGIEGKDAQYYQGKVGRIVKEDEASYTVEFEDMKKIKFAKSMFDIQVVD